MILTDKQEAFAVAFIETGNASEAYRRAYKAENTKPEVVHVKASQALANGKVRVRIAELQAAAAEASGITIETHLQTLAELRDEAREARQFAAAIAAEVARGKASGVHVERTAQTVTIETDDDSSAIAAAERLESRAAAGSSSRTTH